MALLLPEFDPADVRAGRDLIHRLTADAAGIQRRVLREILSRNSATEYLRRFLGGAAGDDDDVRDAFKRRVPVSGYEDVKPYVDRVASGGEPSSAPTPSPASAGGKISANRGRRCSELG